MNDALISFLEIDAPSQRLARLIWPVAEQRALVVTGRFYQAVRTVMPNSPTTEQIEQLRSGHCRRWQRLFDSKFDQEYFSSASLMGIRHCEMGLDCKWHVACYAKLSAELSAEILDGPLPGHSKPNLVATLGKYLALDMAVSLSSYTSIWID